MAFRPQVRQTIHINGATYCFAEHPNAPGMPYGQTGRRATVYQLRDSSGEYHALKVFTQAFRTALTEKNAQQLQAFSHISGMRVCSRIVITELNSPSLVQQFPELAYSVLMPWIDGQTWQEIIVAQQPLGNSQTLSIARGLASILNTMENQQIAHCDLSGANVLLPGLWGRTQEAVSLVDVEDIYSPKLSKPQKLPGGSTGYAHKHAARGLWQADADRFAGAVLIAEMLGWSDPTVRHASAGEHFFLPTEMQTNCDRYQLLSSSLQMNCGRSVVECFSNAWFSESISNCPKFADWSIALASLSFGNAHIGTPSISSSASQRSHSLPSFKPDYIPIQPGKSNPSYRIPGSPDGVPKGATNVPVSQGINKTSTSNLPSPKAPTPSVSKSESDFSWLWVVGIVLILIGIAILLQS